MQRTLVLLFTSLMLCLSVATASPHEEHGHNTHGGEHAKHHDGHGTKKAHISPARAQRVGITTATAGPGTIANTLNVYGKVTTVPDGVSHIRARFPGLITDVRANIGDQVQAGDVVARVESNESLRVYDVKAPISGTITERHANTGEITRDQVLFTIADLDPLWANLKVFPTQWSQVAPGQMVTISSENLQQKTTLRHLIPSSDGHPFVTAHAELENADGRWTPGLLVNGKIQTATADVDLAVASQALQTLDGQTVVFVPEGDGFVPRPVTTGRSDGESTEVLSGLQPGERYVVKNSYLVKADIEKSEAGHSH